MPKRPWAVRIEQDKATTDARPGRSAVELRHGVTISQALAMSPQATDSELAIPPPVACLTPWAIASNFLNYERGERA